MEFSPIPPIDELALKASIIALDSLFQEACNAVKETKKALLQAEHSLKYVRALRETLLRSELDTKYASQRERQLAGFTEDRITSLLEMTDEIIEQREAVLKAEQDHVTAMARLDILNKRRELLQDVVKLTVAELNVLKATS